MDDWIIYGLKSENDLIYDGVTLKYQPIITIYFRFNILKNLSKPDNFLQFKTLISIKFLIIISL